MLKALKNRLAGGANRLQGRTDLLEAVCSSAALVSAADGDVADGEIAATIKAVSASEALRAAFQPREIEQCIEKQLQRAAGGRVGRMQLMKELEDVAANADDAEMVLLTALDVAESDGTIDPAEKAVLGNIAKTLGLNLANYE